MYEQYTGNKCCRCLNEAWRMTECNVIYNFNLMTKIMYTIHHVQKLILRKIYVDYNFFGSFIKSIRKKNLPIRKLFNISFINDSIFNFFGFYHYSLA